jgi:hypothetical protein
LDAGMHLFVGYHFRSQQNKNIYYMHRKTVKRGGWHSIFENRKPKVPCIIDGVETDIQYTDQSRFYYYAYHGDTLFAFKPHVFKHFDTIQPKLNPLTTIADEKYYIPFLKDEEKRRERQKNLQVFINTLRTLIKTNDITFETLASHAGEAVQYGSIKLRHSIITIGGKQVHILWNPATKTRSPPSIVKQADFAGIHYCVQLISIYSEPIKPTCTKYKGSEPNTISREDEDTRIPNSLEIRSRSQSASIGSRSTASRSTASRSTASRSTASRSSREKSDTSRSSESREKQRKTSTSRTRKNIRTRSVSPEERKVDPIPKAPKKKPYRYTDMEGIPIYEQTNKNFSIRYMYKGNQVFVNTTKDSVITSFRELDKVILCKSSLK